MSYEQAMEAAGATILAYESFGSYQGTWIAKVIYQGSTRYISGCFGSCSGCDSFEAEFGGYDDYQCDEHRYGDDVSSCVACKSKAQDYNQRLATFGRSYLENDIHDKESLIEQFTKQAEWDSGAKEVLDWLEAN